MGLAGPRAVAVVGQTIALRGLSSFTKARMPTDDKKRTVCPTSCQAARVRNHLQPASINRPASAIIPQVPSAGTDVTDGAVTVTLTEMSPEFRAVVPSWFAPSARMVKVSVPENPAAGVYVAVNPEKPRARWAGGPPRRRAVARPPSAPGPGVPAPGGTGICTAV